MKKQYLLIAAFAFGFYIGKDRAPFIIYKWTLNRRTQIINKVYDTVRGFLEELGLPWEEVEGHMLDFDGYLVHNVL